VQVATAASKSRNLAATISHARTGSEAIRAYPFECSSSISVMLSGTNTSSHARTMFVITNAGRSSVTVTLSIRRTTGKITRAASAKIR
jgi:hypothetical protein